MKDQNQQNCYSRTKRTNQSSEEPIEMSDGMKSTRLKCEYRKEENCSAVMIDGEGKATRQEGCQNSNKFACCYACAFNHNCDINCEYLGEENVPIKECPLCASKMYPAKANLRIGGWKGIWKLVPFGGLGELGEEVFPVIIYTCSKCGKLDFFAGENIKIEKQATVGAK